MGITIHYSGRAKSDDAVTKLLSVAQTFAAKRGWKFALFDDPLGTSPSDDPPPIGWAGPSRGVAITPHPKCEPVLLDFNTANELSGFTKTQYAPFRVHVQIVELLHAIEPFMEGLTVIDESGLWETGDQAAARARFKFLDDAMDRLAGALRESGCEVEGPDVPIDPAHPEIMPRPEDEPYG